ncbi:hypothetical protein Tco_0842110 [Tanacetum coccineum]|uniref:Uncharacterized protein n=1 Tax=Tanacetum coccineum TaxID=301880 RepID=A0ABQ5B1N6_9ASTR
MQRYRYSYHLCRLKVTTILEDSYTQVFPDTLQLPQSNQALQRRFGIMWRCPHSKDQDYSAQHSTHQMNTSLSTNLPSHWGKRKGPGKFVIQDLEARRLYVKLQGEGHVARQCKEPKRKMDSQYFKDKALLMEAKEKGDVLDAEAEAFLADVECTVPYDQPQALTTTNMFQANHEEIAYDSDSIRPQCCCRFHGQLVIH